MLHTLISEMRNYETNRFESSPSISDSRDYEFVWSLALTILYWVGPLKLSPIAYAHPPSSPPPHTHTSPYPHMYVPSSPSHPSHTLTHPLLTPSSSHTLTQCVRNCGSWQRSLTNPRMTWNLCRAVWGRLWARSWDNSQRINVSGQLMGWCNCDVIDTMKCLPSSFTVIVKASNGPRYVVGCRRMVWTRNYPITAVPKLLPNFYIFFV